MIRAGRVVRLLELLVTLAALLARPASAAERAEALLGRVPVDSALAMGMVQRQAMDSAHAVLAPRIAAARETGDPRLLARWIRLDGHLDINHGDGVAALRRLAEARALAESARDTQLTLFVMRTQAMGENILGRYGRARALAQAWMALAQRARNEEYLGWGETMLAYVDERGGRLESARDRLRRAIRLFEPIGGLGEAYSTNALGNVLAALGDYRGAGETYVRAETLARRIDNRVLLALIVGNHGLVAERLGDPETGMRLHRESARLSRELGNGYGEVVSLDNVATLLGQLGRSAEAVETMEEVLRIVRASGIESEVPWTRAFLGRAYWDAGRRAAAFREWRAVLDSAAWSPVDPVAMAAFGLGSGLIERDSLGAALEVFGCVAHLLEGSAASVSAGLATAHAKALSSVGRPGEAAALVAPFARRAEASGDVEYAVATFTQWARAERLAGRLPEARRAADHAVRWWEASRTRISDPEVREFRGEMGRDLMAEVVEMELAAGGDDAARRAFASVQRFKTRTLLERATGPPSAARPALAWGDLAESSRTPPHEVLADGERLIEWVAGEDTTRMFLVSRDEVRVFALPGTRVLSRTIDLAREVLAAPPRGPLDAAAADTALTRLGALLFPPAAVHALRGARDLLVAPDGPIHRVPVHALRWPGDDRPLAASHRVAVVPSATILSASRTRGAGAGSAATAFAYASDARPGTRALAGAEREVRDLGRRYAGVRVRVLRAGDRDTLAVRDLAGYGVLHLAGHVRVDDQHPWRSGVAAAWPAAGGAPMLTAAEIAATPLGTRLAVLSGCESAGGYVHVGEGVAGLTSAFLAAGVPTVIATLWPVDDRTTEHLTSEFYAALARGADVSAALATATARLREAPRTSHPFFWAGYVLVGEGAVRVPLEERPWPVRDRAALGVALLVMAALASAAIGWRRAGAERRRAA